MNSGSKSSRGTKGTRGSTERSNVSSTHNNQPKSDHNHNEKEKDALPHKIAPTAEQLRIAQMIDNTHPDKGLQEKINQVMQVAGVSTDDAIIALYDCDNDVNGAIETLLEGEDQGEWRESSKKKKKPVSKTKEESESNKENRRIENRERSGTRPRGGGSRFRGRGGRSNKDDSNDGVGRGSRRGRMANGSVPFSRGRGSRGRGSSGGSTRTFQNKQPPGFTETIDTWGPSPEKIEPVDSLQIDNWDDEPSGGTEDWDSEWTGSLDTTTVFGSSVPAPATSATSPDTLEKTENVMPVSSMTNNLDLSGNVTAGTLLGPGTPGPSLQSVQSGGSGSGGSIISSPVSNLSASLPDSGSNVLGMSRSTLPSPPRSSSQQYSSTVPSSSASLSQSQSIDLAALLGGPHSLGRHPTSQVAENSSLGSSGSSLNTSGQASILSSMSSNVGESLKSAVYSSNGSASGPGGIASSTGQSYSSSSPSINDSIFSSSVPGLSSNSPGTLGNSSGVNKVLSLSTQSSSLTRSKQQRARLPHSTSKIPASAVEMPEDAMAALDMQFTGLEFGTESFDFAAEVKPLVGSTLVSGPSLSNRDPSSVSSSVGKELGGLNSSVSQPPSNYSTATSTGVGSSSYPGSSVGSSSSNPSNNSGGGNQSSGYGSGYSGQGSAGTGQYQSNYGSASSHSNLASISVPKTLSGLKDSSQSYNDSSPSSNLSGSLSTNAAAGGASSGSSGLSSSLSSASSNVQPPKSSVPGKTVNTIGSSIPPGVQPHGMAPQQQHLQQQVVQPHHLSQPHQSHHHPLQHQQQVAQQAQQQQTQQQTPQLMAPGPSQYVSPTAALQGALPPAFYNVQQPAMYSYEDLQLFQQQRIPHMQQQQAPTSLPAGRDGAITSPASYSVADAAKFRNDQNSSPVASTINQQGGAAGGTYITAPGSAALPPFYMYHNIPAVPSSFPQYGHPTIIQLPPNTHTGSSNTQFPGPPKLPYGGTSTYYDNISQTQDYKPGYGSGSQGQTKTGPNAAAAGSASNSGSDLGGYKNHLAKVNRSYDKQGFHTGTPPPFNLAGSGTNPMTANAYAPAAMFISTMPAAAAAQHHSPLMHHQLHQDGGSSSSQRAGGVGGVQSKGPSKTAYSGSYWGSN